MMQFANRVLTLLDGAGAWLAPLGLRLILAWEYFESGLEKFRGENWFADIREQFPFPFSVVQPEVSWQMATWFELAGGIALLIGLGTRFFSASLFVLTIVAIERCTGRPSGTAWPSWRRAMRSPTRARATTSCR